MFNGTLVILKSGMDFSHVFPVIIHVNELWNTIIISGAPKLHSFSFSQYTCCTSFATYSLQSKSQLSSLAGDIILEKQETSKMAMQAARLHLSAHEILPG